MSFVSEERKRHTVYPPAEHVFTWTQMCNIKDVSETALTKKNALTPPCIHFVRLGPTVSNQTPGKKKK